MAKAVEMKFVLLFALLAYTKFSLGNTTGAGQSQCATPCNPVNINVYGKEGMKDPNKPSAHIEAVNKRAIMTYQAKTVIKDWSVSVPHSHLAGGMKYHDGKLTVPTPGRYYIYTQLYYHSVGRVHVRVNNKGVTMMQPLNSVTGGGALYAGGVFNLKAGDAISLAVSTSIKLFMGTDHSYFGAFLI